MLNTPQRSQEKYNFKALTRTTRKYTNVYMKDALMESAMKVPGSVITGYDGGVVDYVTRQATKMYRQIRNHGILTQTKKYMRQILA